MAIQQNPAVAKTTAEAYGSQLEKASKQWQLNRTRALQSGNQAAVAAEDQAYLQAVTRLAKAQGMTDAEVQFTTATYSQLISLMEKGQGAFDRQIAAVQRLQEAQAQKLMDMRAQPEQAKVAICSFATTISTVLRMFDCNAEADMIESRANDIMNTVAIRLNTDGISNGMEANPNTGKTRYDIFRDNTYDFMLNSDASRVTGALAAQRPVALPTASGATANPDQASVPPRLAGAEKSTWSGFRKALIDGGLDAQKADGLLGAFDKSAKGLGGVGDAAKLDNAAEVGKLLRSKEIGALAPGEQQIVKDVVRTLEITGSDTAMAR